MAMGQAVWTGSISFGLVSIPVKLYPATEAKDVRFHLYDRLTGKRVRYERVVRAEEAPTFEPEPSDEEPEATAPTESWREERTDRTDARQPSFESRPVERVDVVRGVELPTGDLVTVSDEELLSIAPERSRTIDIEEFVDLAEIDPVFFEKTYHVAPLRSSGAEKPYLLLLRAMQASKMVGIGRFVLRTRPHLVAIRPLENALALETLYFADEVRSESDVTFGLSGVAVTEREIKTAQQLIAALATDWIPDKHGDAYREELLELLRSKRPATPAEPAEEAAPEPIADLMAALRASVEAAKSKRGPKKAKRAG
jgi:DNA end-binding protein Ku